MVVIPKDVTSSGTENNASTSILIQAVLEKKHVNICIRKTKVIKKLKIMTWS